MISEKFLKLAGFAVIFFTSMSLGAGEIKSREQILSNPKCENGGGFSLWDSQGCLFNTGALYLDGKWIKVEEKKTKVLRKKTVQHDSVGDRNLYVYEGENIRVLITVEYLPAPCSYAREQCTYRNMFARFAIFRPGKPTLRYGGVGYAGS